MVGFVTYNVLMPHAADNVFVDTEPHILDSNRRLGMVLGRLRAWMNLGMIISLQEVSLNWYCEIVSQASIYRYTAVPAMYGRGDWAHGQVTLVPPGYRISKCDIVRIGELIRADQDETLHVEPWWKRAVCSLSFGLYCSPKWERSADRYDNLALMLQLNAPNKTYVVANYHMPCAFRRPHVMELHTQYLARAIDSFRGSGHGLVVCGDFNLQPSSHVLYKFMDRLNLRSAVDLGIITTKSRTRSGDFVGTIDYIFYADCELNSDGPDVTHKWMPNEHEPSDHYPLVAF